jgi:hypothetical protein
LNNFVQSGIIADILFLSASADKVSKMTQKQLKLKEAWDAILTETDHTAKHGDHSSHSGYFNSESGCGEPPYTGDGIGAEEDLKEWEEFMNDPLAMFDWEDLTEMPSLTQEMFEEWLNIQKWKIPGTPDNLNNNWFISLPPELSFVQVALVQAFARDFFEVATGKSFEVVSL